MEASTRAGAVALTGLVLVGTLVAAIVRTPRSTVEAAPRARGSSEPFAARRPVRAADAPSATPEVPERQSLSGPPPAPEPTRGVSSTHSEHYPKPTWTTADLVAALAHDDMPHNAGAAQVWLSARPEAEPELRAALRSLDYQQRQLAALLLVKRDATPDDLLLGVLCESLAAEGDDPARHSGVWSLEDRVRYLARHVEPAAEHLLRALDTADAQGRYFAAYLLAHHPTPPAAVRCFEELSAHLADDGIPRNATLAVDALVLLEPFAGDAWIAAYSRLDAQGRGFLERVRERLEFRARHSIVERKLYGSGFDFLDEAFARHR